MARPHCHLPQLLELRLLAFVLNVASLQNLSDRLDSILPSLAAGVFLAVSSMQLCPLHQSASKLCWQERGLSSATSDMKAHNGLHRQSGA